MNSVQAEFIFSLTAILSFFGVKSLRRFHSDAFIKTCTPRTCDPWGAT